MEQEESSLVTEKINALLISANEQLITPAFSLELPSFDQSSILYLVKYFDVSETDTKHAIRTPFEATKSSQFMLFSHSPPLFFIRSG